MTDTLQESRFRLQLDVPVPMRDGTLLRADIYTPDSDEKMPVILIRHPYTKNRDPLFRDVEINRILTAGYILAFQDIRGRHTSEGEFVPSVNEVSDGVDSVKWASELPHSNGQVAMWGSSYAAEAQWAAALGGAEELVSIIPVNSPAHSHFLGYSVRGGAQEFALRIGWVHRSISMEALRRARPDLTDRERTAEYAHTQDQFDSGELYWHLPFKPGNGIPEVLDASSAIFTMPFDSPNRDVTSTAGKYDDLQVPAFMVGGWFDCFIGSTLAQFKGVTEAAERQGTHKPYLVVGPWSHRSAGDRLGDQTFGAEAKATLPGPVGSFTDQILHWLDATVRGNSERLLEVPPVRLFLMGTNKWLGFDQYPPQNDVQTWYLDGSGALTTTPAEEQSHATYSYDPQNPVPTRGGPLLLPDEYPSGPVRQNPLYERDDVLSFTSESLEEDINVIGRITATLHAVTDAPDTDFVVKVCDVDEAGNSYVVVDGIVRLSERDRINLAGEFTGAARHEDSSHLDVELTVDLLHTCYTFRAGHKIQVDVTSSNFPRWDRNLNTGLSMFESDETRVAHQTIKLGGSTLSSVHLPVVPASVVSDAVI